jgi:hypothetical protein
LYREVFDLLAPGGWLINIEHVASADRFVEHQWDLFLIDALDRHHRARRDGVPRATIATDYVYRSDKQANILAPTELQCDWLRSIGFVHVDCYCKVFEMAVFGGRRPVSRRPAGRDR